MSFAPSATEARASSGSRAAVEPPTALPQTDPRRSTIEPRFGGDAGFSGEPAGDDDVRSQSTAYWYVLHPVTRARLAWDYVLRALVLGTFFVVPIRLTPS